MAFRRLDLAIGRAEEEASEASRTSADVQLFLARHVAATAPAALPPAHVLVPTSARDVRAAIARTSLLVLAAVAFDAGVFWWRGREQGLQFAAAYVLELSLSVDNLFVFRLIFDSFLVEGRAQERCLSWGIWTAAVLRLGMISAGLEVMRHFHPILLVFAILLLLSAASILVELLRCSAAHTEGEPEEALRCNWIVRTCSSLLRTSPSLDGDRFFTDAPGGGSMATPLLLALVCIEFADIAFAFDSVPAVLAVTDDKAIAFSSNIFAIAGLRSLFRVLSVMIDRFELLQPAVALILAFVGAKMAADYFGRELSIAISLSVIVATLIGGVLSSVLLKWARQRCAQHCAPSRAPAVPVGAEAGVVVEGTARAPSSPVRSQGALVRASSSRSFFTPRAVQSVNELLAAAVWAATPTAVRRSRSLHAGGRRSSAAAAQTPQGSLSEVGPYAASMLAGASTELV